MQNNVTCEDVAVELSSGIEGLSAEAAAHLSSCADCQATAKLLGASSLPPLSATERAAMNEVSASTVQAWRARAEAPRGRSRFAGLAMAAGLGALLASGALSLRPLPEPRVELRTEVVTAPDVPDFTAEIDSDELNLSPDDVFFEVGWPSPTEGDL